MATTDGSNEYVKVTEKEIAEAVKEDGYVVGTQEDDEGTERVYRMSVSEIYETMTEKAEAKATEVATEIIDDNMAAIQEATESANSAADAANTSASTADTAASNAESATEAAKTATEEANAAAEAAKTATSDAETATTSANTAADNANTAATAANTAASNADTATSNANAAAEAAKTATSDADAATTAANEAADNANAAAENANNVASEVTSAWNTLNASIVETVNTTLTNVADDYAAWKEQADSDLAAAIENAEEATDNANTAADTANAAAEKCDAVTAENLEYALASLVNSLDGTFATYKTVMRKCYLLGSWESVTAFCDWWYGVTRDSWCGATEFYLPDVSAVSTGTKTGDNADLTCTPSTDTVANQDDYAGLPLFACIDCNWEVDADTLQPVITAIDGITDNFVRTDPTVYVGVLQMAGYMYFVEGDETYTIGYTSLRNAPYKYIEPVPDSVNPDNNVRNWVVHAKYMSHTTDGLMTSCSGLIPTAFISHNSLHTLSANNGSQYSGSTVTDDTWLYLMCIIKYGSLTLDGIIQGCVSNNYQYPALVSEEGVNRILISTSNNLEVGMSVIVGYYNSSSSSPLDRGTAAIYSTSTNAGCLITKIETVTVDDTDYSAIYVDLDSFDTTANGTATEGTTYISTWHWATGTTDGVLGNDGSPTSCTSGKYPAKLQGIEFANGAYEVLADVILSLYQDSEDESVYYYEPYVVMASANQSTAITDNYIATGLIIEQPSSASWLYIKRREYAYGVFFATLVGGTSSTYTRDAFYMNAAATGTREWLARGRLNNGSGSGGLSCLIGNFGLSAGYWHFAARLSANGNRGEWVA